MGQILQQYSIIAELEDAVRNGSSEKRVGTLRQVTDLFLHEGDRLSEDQVQVFDDVLGTTTSLSPAKSSPTPAA